MSEREIRERQRLADACLLLMAMAEGLMRLPKIKHDIKGRIRRRR